LGLNCTYETLIHSYMQRESSR